MDAALERVWARWCARRVMHLWDAPEVVVRWLDEGEEEIREAAHGTAMMGWRSVSSATPAKALAAIAVERAASPSLALLDLAASYAAEAAASARYDSADDGWGVARVAEGDAQQHARALISTLSALLPEQGLAALRLDEALEDRWLTREVWRSLGLPDLQVVCDWAEVSR